MNTRESEATHKGTHVRFFLHTLVARDVKMKKKKKKTVESRLKRVVCVGWDVVSLACVGSTSPWMMFRVLMYLDWLKSLLRLCEDTMMFFVCSSRRVTQSRLTYTVHTPRAFRS